MEDIVIAFLKYAYVILSYLNTRIEHIAESYHESHCEDQGYQGFVREPFRLSQIDAVSDDEQISAHHDRACRTLARKLHSRAEKHNEHHKRRDDKWMFC